MTRTRDGHTFLHYELTAETLCLGERLRGGLFRPCARVFRYSSLVGALKASFGGSDTIHATARFQPGGPGTNRMEILSLAPHDRGLGLSAVPLEIEYLSNVRAEVFILKTDHTVRWPRSFCLSMGAMKSKGFGRCQLKFIDEVSCQTPKAGELCVRLPDVPSIREALGIRTVLAPVYGYLFQPTSPTSGTYVKSLFEGSLVVGCDVLFASKWTSQ